MAMDLPDGYLIYQRRAWNNFSMGRDLNGTPSLLKYKESIFVPSQTIITLTKFIEKEKICRT
jgi:hypothetical protein